MNQGREIPIGLLAFSAAHRALPSDALQLGRNLVTDLESGEANVRTDRNQELARGVTEGTKRVRHDAGHCTTPASVNRSDVAGRGVRDEQRNAVCGTRRDGDVGITSKKRIAFGIGDARRVVHARHHAHFDAVNLALLEQSIERYPEVLDEASPILVDRSVLVAEVVTEVERIEGRSAHTAMARSEGMAETMPLQKDRMQRTHSVCSSMARLRELLRRARSRVLQVRAGSWQLHRFPSAEWTQALKVALNTDREYREVGKPWTFGPVAMIVRADSSYGLERDAGIVLDVHQGECRGARFVEGESDPADAEFVIVGTYARWRDVIEGRLDPIKAMMEGKLKLARGHLPTIIRFVEPSRLVVASASKVPTWFSE